VKVAVALPAGTLTDAGTLSFALLVLTATEVAAETACERVIVHVVDVLEMIAGGVHASVEIRTATLTLRVWVTPYPLAVKVALRLFPVIVPDITVKLADVAPAGTLTVAGTVSAVELLDSEKDSGAGAAAASVTVQLAVAPAINCVPDTTGRAHVSPERAEIAGLAVIFADNETPLKEAVIVAD
jgi:hypothetical protein